ncbi:LysE family translocator, partial [Streptomyces sp. MCAF7]
VYTGVGTAARAVLRACPAAARAVIRCSGAAMVAIGALLLVERLLS